LCVVLVAARKNLDVRPFFVGAQFIAPCACREGVMNHAPTVAKVFRVHLCEYHCTPYMVRFLDNTVWDGLFRTSRNRVWNGVLEKEPPLLARSGREILSRSRTYMP
jgi:hypothetical protein